MFSSKCVTIHWNSTEFEKPHWKRVCSPMALITTTTGRGRISTSLWKYFEGMTCQTCARNFYKLVKDTDVRWCACTPFHPFQDYPNGNEINLNPIFFMVILEKKLQYNSSRTNWFQAKSLTRAEFVLYVSIIGHNKCKEKSHPIIALPPSLAYF